MNKKLRALLFLLIFSSACNTDDCIPPIGPGPGSDSCVTFISKDCGLQFCTYKFKCNKDGRIVTLNGISNNDSTAQSLARGECGCDM